MSAARPNGKAAPPALLIGGPTASGKSALAIAAARAWNGVVVNADSMQLYRELEILTARPSAADMAAAPHRLFGVLPLAEAGSVARWRAMAVAEAEAAAAAGRLPILVGGTGLYLAAFLRGLAPIPDIPAAIRAAARAALARLGPEGLHARLARRDPATAARLAPRDRQRILRAWEVLEATGRPLADWQAAATAAPAPAAVTLLLLPPRQALYEACDRRFRAMMAAGALDEARRVDALGLDPTLPGLKAHGLPELRRHLAGELTLEEAIAAAQQSTRRYAKRQYTWFRHQMPAAIALPHAVRSAQDSQRILSEIFAKIRPLLLTLQP